MDALLVENGFNFVLFFKFKGTEAWIDALGYMRLKKYIADKDGYRILKSQTVFVGKTPIKVYILLPAEVNQNQTTFSLSFAGCHHKWTN